MLLCPLCFLPAVVDAEPDRGDPVACECLREWRVRHSMSYVARIRSQRMARVARLTSASVCCRHRKLLREREAGWTGRVAVTDTLPTYDALLDPHMPGYHQPTGTAAATASKSPSKRATATVSGVPSSPGPHSYVPSVRFAAMDGALTQSVSLAMTALWCAEPPVVRCRRRACGHAPYVSRSPLPSRVGLTRSGCASRARVGGRSRPRPPRPPPLLLPRRLGR